MRHYKTGFARRVISEIRVALASANFEYIGSKSFRRRLSPEAVGLLTVITNYYKSDPSIYVNVSLGVVHERIEGLLAQLLGQKPSMKMPATIGISLGYVTPENKYVMYQFGPEDEIEKRAHELAASVERYGLDWMKHNQTLDAMLDGMMTSRLCSRDRARFRIPVIYYLRSELFASHASLSRGLSEIDGNNDTYSEQFRQFAMGLQTLIDNKDK